MKYIYLLFSIAFEIISTSTIQASRDTRRENSINFHISCSPKLNKMDFCGNYHNEHI